jgi:glycosyltransferase involved in cell wall biosynthesis
MLVNSNLLLWLVAAVLALGGLYIIAKSNRLWRLRGVISEAVIALLVIGLPFLLLAGLPMPVAIILGALQLWLLVLGMRLVAGRLPEEFLRASTRLNTAIAGMVIVLALGAGWVPQVLHIGGSFGLVIFATSLFSMLLASVFVYQAIWALKHYRLRKLNQYITLQDLPAVTLAIPARNETRVLSDCLAAAVASDYPKLEIIVLDDCSQDKTSDVIRSYAQHGIRFVQGKLPADGWLGKNQAQQTLAEQASGEFIVFSGVDTHLSPQSLRKLVTYALSNNTDMVSVLPQLNTGLSLAALLWQLRYYWQIVLPITPRRVPVASQCWMIRRDMLVSLGGLAAVKHKIVPEGSFARRLFGQDKYRFIVSNPELGITTAKRYSSQNATALRFLYPTFKRQPLYVFIGCILLVALMLAPFLLAVALALRDRFNLLWWLALVNCALLLVGYALVVARAVPRVWPLLLLTFPLCLVQELLLLITSMLAYEFAEVNWKGRNVCYPVMTVYGHLPRLDR